MNLKIGYFGDGIWAHNALRLLLQDNLVKVMFVCVRFDHRDPVLIDIADNNEIPILFLSNVNSKDSIQELSKYGCDLFVSMSFNQIFKNEVINLPKLKTINCHAGKLPFYRGRNILNWVLINDEKEFGITVHYVDEGIDTGDIILQKSFPINDEDDYGSLLELAHSECASILVEAIKQIQKSNVHRIKQIDIHPYGMYCGTRIAGDEIIDWNQSSREIFCFIRALKTPGPNACSYINGHLVQILDAQLIKDAPIYKGIPGQILGKGDNSIVVKTRDSVIELSNYISKSSIRIGDRFKDE